MIKPIALDSGPLGALAHPRRNTDIAAWLDGVLAAGVVVYLPEIIDYEVRRGLLAAHMTRSVRRLDQLKDALTYLSLTTATMLEAASLWAQARQRGQAVADPKELDGDVILAAQAQQVGAMVATENVGHLALFVEAKSWRATVLYLVGNRMSREIPLEITHLRDRLRQDFTGRLPEAPSGSLEERERNFLSRALAAFATQCLSGCL